MPRVIPGEKRLNAQCCKAIKIAMGCENREPQYEEVVQFLRENAQNELLWLCIAGAVKGKTRFDCLERALNINPDNKKTFRLMEIVNPRRAYKVAKRMKLKDP